MLLLQNQLWGTLWLLEAGEEQRGGGWQQPGAKASPRAVWRELHRWPKEKGINGTSMILPNLYWPLGGCGMRVLSGRVPPGPYQAAAGWSRAEPGPAPWVPDPC